MATAGESCRQITIHRPLSVKGFEGTCWRAWWVET